jgi:hypothetical protein
MSIQEAAGSLQYLLAILTTLFRNPRDARLGASSARASWTAFDL